MLHRMQKMGPSGSGKTTLLDVLAGRKTKGRTDGTLLFSGQKPTPAFLQRWVRHGPHARACMHARLCIAIGRVGASCRLHAASCLAWQPTHTHARAAMP